jgi:hypothetical protein
LLLAASCLSAIIVSACAAVPASLLASPGSATADKRAAFPESANAPGSQTTVGGSIAGDQYVLLPRTPGESGSLKGSPALIGNAGGGLMGAPGSDSASGGLTGSGASPAPAASAAPTPASTAGQVQDAATCAGAQTLPFGLYGIGGQVLVASAKGLHTLAADGTWSTVGNPFPCGTVPAALAAGASGSYFAGAPDGIYALDPQTRGWSRVARASRIVDLDVTPDRSFGMAVEETGQSYRFDGSVWTAQQKVDQTTQQPIPLRLAPLMGSVRVLSASESYAVGSDGRTTHVIGKWNGLMWDSVAQPDASDPIAGLAVRHAGGPALVATTRSALYRLASDGWVLELPRSTENYLGTPSFNGSFGLVGDLGVSGGKVFRYAAATWQAAPTTTEPLESVAVLQNGDGVALGADGESLFRLSGGSWVPLPAP